MTTMQTLKCKRCHCQYKALDHLTYIYATRKSFSVIEWLDLFGQENLMKSDVLYCGQRLIKPLQLNAMIKFKGKAEEMRIASSCLDFRALSVKEEKE